MQMQPFCLELLGPAKLSIDGQWVESGLWAKSMALLAYLATEKHTVHRRETVAELLWPDKPRGAALTSLRQAISQLRKSIPALNAHLHITPQAVQFRSDCWEGVDVARFEHLLDVCDKHVHVVRSGCGQCVERLEQAAGLYNGQFMTGFFLKDSAEFEAWLGAKRQIYARMAISALSDMAEHYLEKDHIDKARQAALRQIQMDPYREIAHRQYMRSLIACGQRTAAITHFERYQVELESDLGIRPEAETVFLYEQIGKEGQNTSVLAGSGDPGRFSLPGASTGIQPKSVFVGRKKELSFLQSRFHETLKGRGQIVLVAGEAGWGKTSLIDAFLEQVRAARPNVIPAYGKGNAYTGMGDPFLPFRDILGFLTGDVETRWAAGTVSQDLAYRINKLLPLVAQAVTEDGPDLIDVFVSGQTLLQRVKEVFADEKKREPAWLDRLRSPMHPAEPHRGAQSALTQKNLFEQYTRVLVKIAGQSPLVLVLDDMQWIDAGSVSLLFHLSKRLANSRILLIGAYRPLDLRINSAPGQAGIPDHLEQERAELDFRNRHPLEYVINELKRDGGNIEVALSQAEAGFTDALIDSVPNILGQAFRTEFYNRTQGHPLFAVELLQSLIVNGGLVKERSGRLAEGEFLDWEILPAKIEALINERLGRLPRRLLNVLNAASVEGEYFTAEIIAVALKAEENEIIQMLSDEIGKEHRLIAPESIEWQQDGQRLSKYRFGHTLFQKYIYTSLDPIERVHWHARIASAIETLFGENTGPMAVPLSWHFENAGDKWKAVYYLNKAGENALRLTANQEAMAHFTHALDLLAALPDTNEKNTLELILQINLAVSKNALQSYSYAEIGQAFSRAYELCTQTGDIRRAFPVLWQLALYRSSLSDFTGGAAMMQEILELVEPSGDSLLIALGHWGLGWSKFWVGDYISSQQHLAIMINLYKPQQNNDLAIIYSQDPGAASHAILALDLLALGYPDQAAQSVQFAVESARQVNHQHTLALTLAYVGMMFGFSGQFMRLQKIADELTELTLKNEFVYWYSAGLQQKGWALSYLGQAQEGIRLLSQALSILQASNVEIGQEVLHITLAEVLSQHGKAAQGLELIDRQIASSRKSGGLFLMPEQLRVRAEALRALGPAQEANAETAFQESIGLARAQRALFLELKSSLGLARLWKSQGKVGPAWSVLSKVYARFTEGFDLPDMQAACQLLKELKPRKTR